MKRNSTAAAMIAILLALLPALGMAESTYSTHYNFEKPTRGDLNWSTALNANFDAIDTLFDNQTVKIGAAITAAIDTDSAMTANLDTKVASQKATKTAIAAAITAAIDTDSAMTANLDTKVASQKATKTAMALKARAEPSVGVFHDTVIIATPDTWYSSVLRCATPAGGPAGGNLDTVATSLTGLSGSFTYLILNANGTITKGAQPYYWLETSLTSNQTILAFKNYGNWCSKHPQVHACINTARPKILTFSTTVISATSTDFYIGPLRICDAKGAFIDVASAKVSGLSGLYAYVTLNISNGSAVFGAGTQTYAWQEMAESPARVIVAFKNNGCWQSNYPNISRLLHEADYHTTLGAATEKIVKVGGTPGTDCDYTSIKAALDAITDSSAAKPYTIRVQDGTYDISNDGNTALGLKNYVTIIGQSRKGTIIVKRQTTYDAGYNGFDAGIYTGTTLEYAAIKNMTIRTHNCKAPIHIDNSNPFTSTGTIEIENCDLINENTAGGNVGNCLAVGLSRNQKVISKNVFANGFLWAHNNVTKATSGGCSFELYNCLAQSIAIGDEISYNADKLVISGCKIDHFTFYYYKDFPTAGDSHLQIARPPSFAFDFSGNDIGYIDAVVVYEGGGSITDTDAMAVLYGGKWSITDSSIHNYCHNEGADNITKWGLVALNADSANGIELWSTGRELYGVALDNITSGGFDDNSFGIVQYNGTVDLSADGTTPIVYDDQLELNSSGVAVKRSTGTLVGYARAALGSGTGTIQVKLIKK